MNNPRATLQDWLGELGREAGLPALGLDEDDFCALILDGHVVVNLDLEADTGELLLYTHLCPLPPERRETLYALLLEGNYFWRDTGGATLGIDREANTVMLAYAAPLALLDSQGFRRLLGRFADTGGHWLNRLQAVLEEEIPPPATDQPLPMIRV